MSKPSKDWLAVANGIAELTARIRSRYDTPVVDGKFVSNTWEGFELKYNLDLLISNKSSYLALREATFAAFCSWVIAPNDVYFRKQNIISAIAGKLCEHETVILQETNVARFALDAMKSVTDIGPDFYEQIYYPIGGLSAMLNCPSVEQMRSMRAQKSKEVARIIFMTKVMHYVSENLSDLKIYNAPSKGLTIKTLQEIGNINGVALAKSNRTSGPSWAEYEPAMLMLYAASNIQITNSAKHKGKNFVQVVLDGEANYADLVQFIPEMLGRAQYLKSAVGRHVSKTARRVFEMVELPPTVSIETECLDVEFGVDVIMKIYSRKRRNQSLQ